MINVLFVCLGNICRSPMAEGLFRDLLKKENLSSKVSVDSVGQVLGILVLLRIKERLLFLKNITFQQTVLSDVN